MAISDFVNNLRSYIEESSHHNNRKCLKTLAALKL